MTAVLLALGAAALALVALVAALDARAVARRALESAARAATDVGPVERRLEEVAGAAAEARATAKRALDALSLPTNDKPAMRTFLRPSKSSRR